ncbi:Neurotransmitter-gated ion-channel transmembrane region family protein [Brugia malayi]|uniref:Gamma-aminobutyric acid receptor subunit beta n=2 Tax=Brugia malayi TaxID=6279 RepID=A0A4E9F7A6_BRUMA|nr:Neurotransmitter-gated ion-channel transmembrane region family protein [Brugia malayi]VIO92724.1 Neurotransmitter-gated ion-channel transmembrane region family protein [Brugia malayi]
MYHISYIFIVYYIIYNNTTLGYIGYPSGTTFNTTAISDILNRLVDKSTYDKRLRPKYGAEPVDVGITIHVSSISAVSEVDMDFTLDFYLRQTWQDPRLAFGDMYYGYQKGKIESLTVGVDYLEKLWKPDTFFPNEKKSFFHTATTHNSFLRIDPDGTVFTSQRLTVTATCPMKLQLFPMDSQKCKLEIESYGYTTADIALFWGKDRRDQGQVVGFENISLPQFKPVGYRVNVTRATTSSGVYVRLYFEVLLGRNLGFYLMNIIIPSMLIVTISWVSFWLNREASPARVGLGVTTVLTMTTLITTTNNAMPKVSYIKGLDVFLNFCFVMVFASLIEYAVVSYMNKKLAQRRERRRKQAEQRMPVEMPMYGQITSSAETKMQMDTFLGGPSQNPNISVTEAMMPECDCRTIPLIQNPRLVTDRTLWPAPFMKPKRASRTCRSVTPSKIDKCSRFFFPMLFFTFNLFYWTIMTVLSSFVDTNGYTIATIHYHWCQLKDVHCEAAVKVEPFELTSYRFTSLCINKTIATTSSGSYSRLWAQFLFEREFSFYMIQIYIPAILVVFISWVSFWINPESAPSRTVIGTFTILSETHLLMSTNRRLPPVSYIKAVDVYLGFCYLNVVLALIEYATVTYSRKKYEDEKKNKSKNIFELTPQLQAPDLLQDARIDECTCEQDVSVFVVAKPKCPLKCATFCKHNRVDLIARIVFPVSFLTFNFIYWTVLLSLSKWRIYGDNAEQRAC